MQLPTTIDTLDTEHGSWCILVFNLFVPNTHNESNSPVLPQFSQHILIPSVQFNLSTNVKAACTGYLHISLTTHTTQLLTNQFNQF